MRKIAVLLIALFLAVSFSALAQSVGNGGSPQSAGNGGANCQINPGLSAGNDTLNSCEATKKANGYLGANGSVTACGTTMNNSYGNGVNWLGIADPGYNNREIIAVPVPTTSPNATATAVQFCSYNRTTGALNVGGVQANQTAGVPGLVCFTASSTHSEPSLNGVGFGYFMGTACGTNTGSTNLCLTAAGGGGTATFCDPIFWGNCLSTDCGGAFTSDISKSTNMGFMAGSGLSEATVTHYYGYGGGIITMSGQNTSTGVVAGSSNGQQAYTTIRDAMVSGTYHAYEDTACSVGGTINATSPLSTTGSGGWDITTQTNGGLTPGSGLTQVCNGIEQFSLPIHASNMALLDVTVDTNAGVITITLPTHGGWTAGTCKFTMTGVGTTDAANLVTAITTGVGWTAGGTGACASSGTYWDSIALTAGGCTAYSTDANCTGPASATAFSVSIEPINANPNAMAVVSESTTAGTVSVFDMRAVNTGNNDHFNYGTMQLLTSPAGTPFYCALLDNQIGRTPAPSQIGTVNAQAFDFMILCSRGPDLTVTGAPSGNVGAWVWGDAGMLNPTGPNDGFSYTISPATLGNPTTGATPSPAPFEQFQMGSSWTTCTSAAVACQTYKDASGTATNSYGWVKPCTCTPWTGFVPYIYTTSNRNQDITNGGLSNTSGFPAPVLSSYWMVIDQTLDLDVVRPCGDNNGAGIRVQICFEQINPFSAVPQTVTEACIDCTNTLVQNYSPQLAVVRAPSGDLVALEGDQYGGQCNGTTHYPCFEQYVLAYNQTTLTYASTWTKTVLGSCPVNSLTRGAAIDTTVQGTYDGLHLTAVCWATGATTAYQFDLPTGSL